MIKPDQIPDEVVEAAHDAVAACDGKDWMRVAIAAALNAWPFGAVCHYTIKNTEGWELVLPLPQSNEEGN